MRDVRFEGAYLRDARPLGLPSKGRIVAVRRQLDAVGRQQATEHDFRIRNFELVPRSIAILAIVGRRTTASTTE
jgi:hypothetical protein